MDKDEIYSQLKWRDPHEDSSAVGRPMSTQEVQRRM